MTERRNYFGDTDYMDAIQEAVRAAGPRHILEGWNVRFRAALERRGLALMPLGEATQRGLMGHPGSPCHAPRPIEAPEWWHYPHPSVIVERPRG